MGCNAVRYAFACPRGCLAWLVQMDGLTSRPGAGRQQRGVGANGVLVLAASNCPWDLDAALRRWGYDMTCTLVYERMWQHVPACMCQLAYCSLHVPACMCQLTHAGLLRARKSQAEHSRPEGAYLHTIVTG